jgi:hypothetical protein
MIHHFSPVYAALPTDMGFTFISLPHVCLLILLDVLEFDRNLMAPVCAGNWHTVWHTKGLSFVK